MKIAFLLGTHSKIRKMIPVVRECQKRNIDFYILGQHYSFEMDKAFFENLKRPVPKPSLDVILGMHREQTSKVLNGIEQVLIECTHLESNTR